MKTLYILETRAGVGHGGVDVTRESIGEETIKRCVCDEEIHIWIKQTSVEIIKYIFLEIKQLLSCLNV